MKDYSSTRCFVTDRNGPTQQVATNLTREVYNKLDELARAENVTRAEIARRAIVAYVMVRTNKEP